MLHSGSPCCIRRPDEGVAKRMSGARQRRHGPLPRRVEMNWWPMKKRDADLERELRSDLELEEEEQRERGVGPDEARYPAMRAFGNPALIREQTRVVWSWNWLGALGRVLLYDLPTLPRTPGLSRIGMVEMS